jgi:hypothetical protein
MSTTHTNIAVRLTLPRSTREVIARITDGLARRGNGMSKHAASAVEKLLSPSDLTELTYLEAVAVQTQCQGEQRRIELARERGRATVRHALAQVSIEFADAQLQPQLSAATAGARAVATESRMASLGEIRMGQPGKHRAPEAI